MIRLNVLCRDSEFQTYIDRAQRYAAGLNVATRLQQICKGENTLLYTSIVNDFTQIIERNKSQSNII